MASTAEDWHHRAVAAESQLEEVSADRGRKDAQEQAEVWRQRALDAEAEIKYRDGQWEISSKRLRAALELKANAGGAIKDVIREVLRFSH